MNIGIIGYGNRIRYILKLLLSYNHKHKIIALYDPDSKAIQDYKQTYGQDIQVYDNCQDLVKNPNLDWVFIGSINSVHKEQIILAFNAGKNVFCEKPIAISVDECKEIKEKFEEKNLNFFISYTLRYSPHYKKIKEILESGKIGKIVSLEFNEVLSFGHGASIMSCWRRLAENSGGHLIEKCCHDIDLVNWFTKSLPKRVASFGGLNFFKLENSYIFDKIKDVKSNPFNSNKDIVDNQVVILEYFNGVRATFHTNLSSGIPERRMYICGIEGTLRADVLTGKIEIKRIDSKEKEIIINKEIVGGHGGGDDFLVRELNKCMDFNLSPEISIDDAIKSALICLAIDYSMNNGEVVNLGSIWKNFNY